MTWVTGASVELSWNHIMDTYGNILHNFSSSSVEVMLTVSRVELI